MVSLERRYAAVMDQIKDPQARDAALAKIQAEYAELESSAKVAPEQLARDSIATQLEKRANELELQQETARILQGIDHSDPEQLRAVAKELRGLASESD